MLGWEEDEIGNTPEEWYNRVHSDDLNLLRETIASHLEGSTSHFECEYRMLHKNQSYRWILCRGLAVRDMAGQAYRMAGSQTDITDRKVAEEQLFYTASHDVLTGLANRSLFLEYLEQALQRTKRYQNSVFAVLFLDLDHFKVVNDSLGHEIGDHLLIEFAHRLEGCIRPVDTVARLGGDEFTILLDQIKTLQGVLSIVERIQSALKTPFRIDQHEIFMTASIGITLSTTEYERPGDVLRDADTAMYRAKKAGRAQYALFDMSMYTSAKERFRLETELRRAIEYQEFRTYYQPIISMPTGQIIKAEVLLRWQHPQRGLILPAEFIPLAEETGLIIPMTEWLIHTVCAQQKSWQDDGYPHIILTINLSARELQYPNLPQQIERILDETSVAADTIELEITETTVMENIHSILTTLHKLSSMGIKISIDDFGSGHSSLGRLKHLPIQTLKIDRSFIREMTHDQDNAILTKAIIAIAGSLNLQVIAKGVETSEQLTFLQENQCNKFQGYLFSQPMPAEEFTKYLQEKRHVVPGISQESHEFPG
jgi:diguanylate cyclase (GGDEF)-like protein/PAS domain S-box-containing protein